MQNQQIATFEWHPLNVKGVVIFNGIINPGAMKVVLPNANIA